MSLTISTDMGAAEVEENIIEYLQGAGGGEKNFSLLHEFESALANESVTGSYTVTALKRICDDLGMDVEWEDDEDDQLFLSADRWEIRTNAEPKTDLRVFWNEDQREQALHEVVEQLHAEDKVLFKEFAQRVRTIRVRNLGYTKPGTTLEMMEALAGDYVFWMED